MKHFYSFSRLAAVMLAAVLALPVWADGNPVPDEYYQKYGVYTEEAPVALNVSFPIGTQFTMTEQFPELSGKTFKFDYGSWEDVPKSDNESAVVIEVSDPFYDSNLPFANVTLGDAYCISGGTAHITVWAFDSEWDDANVHDVFTKKYTYNITITVTNEIQPGYVGQQEGDPTAIHDIKLYVGEKREDWITYHACQAFYSPANEEEPATFDVDCSEILDENTHERYPVLTSSDESIVHIGAASYYSAIPTIEAVAPGEATITVTSIDPGEYYTAAAPQTFKVTVLDGSQEHPGEGGLHFTNLNRHNPDFPLFRAYTGHDFALPTLVNETGLPNSELQFTSTNTDVATIDDNGVITLTGVFGETWISVEQKYYPKNHSDMFNLAVTTPFSVMGYGIEPSQYDDILNDGGSLKYIPETHTFVMHNLHADYLNGEGFTEDYYGDLHNEYMGESNIPAFIDWNMPDEVHIRVTGKNEILHAQRIVKTDTTICHNVSFEGHGSLYAKIYFSSFVNGVYTNSFVQSSNDWREVTAEGDTVTNITIDGASIAIDRDVTHDFHYPNYYSQIISVNKLKVINKGYIRAKFVGEEFAVKNIAKAVITLKELETDETTAPFYYLDWVDDYGYNHDQPDGQMYRSKSFLSYYRTAIIFEAGPTIDVAETEYSYNFISDNPTSSSYIAFENSTAAQHEYGAGILMYRGYADRDIEQGLKTIAPRTEIWNEEFPGVISLYLSRGSGTINMRSKINTGYRLKVMIVDGNNTLQTYFEGAGTEEDYAVPYALENSAYAAIYMQSTAQTNAPHRAPQQKMDEPGLILKSLGAEPEYVGEMETVSAKEDPDAAGNYYATFYNSDKNYRLANDGTEAYYATISGDGNLLMSLVAENNNVILKNHAVVLKATKATIGLIPELDVPTYPVKADATSASNDLLGTDDAIVAPAGCYMLSDHSADNSVTGIGFYPFTGTLEAHKAYITYEGAVAPERMRIVFDNGNTPTTIDDMYQPTKAEKFIENGQLIIIRNGERYNAQGQIVK